MVSESPKALTDIPNVGEAMERNFLLLGIERPADLIGSYPYQLYEENMYNALSGSFLGK